MIGSPLLQARGEETVPTSLFVLDQNRQRDADLLLLPGGDVPRIGIFQMRKDDFLHINRGSRFDPKQSATPEEKYT